MSPNWKKNLVVCFYDSKGIVHIEIVPNCHNVIGDYDLDILESSWNHTLHLRLKNSMLENCMLAVNNLQIVIISKLKILMKGTQSRDYECHDRTRCQTKRWKIDCLFKIRKSLYKQTSCCIYYCNQNSVLLQQIFLHNLWKPNLKIFQRIQINWKIF